MIFIGFTIGASVLRLSRFFHSGYSVYITKPIIYLCEAPVCFTFPTAVCTFRSGERIFRSGECTYRTAEYKTETSSFQNHNSYSEYITTTVITHSPLLSTYHNNVHSLARTRARARSINFQFLLSLLSLTYFNPSLSNI